MAILKGKARQDTAVERVGEGSDIAVRATRDGAIFTADWRQALIVEGRGFMVNVGAFSTGLGGGGTASVVDIDAPSLVIGVPNGTSIMPLRIEIQVADPVAATAAEEVDIIIAYDQDSDQGSASGTATAETIYNMNTLHSRASRCWSNSLYTTAMTTPVLDVELAHLQKVVDWGSSVGGIWTEMTMLYEPKTMPVINGPAMLCVYFGGTAATEGFICAQWLELPSNQI